MENIQTVQNEILINPIVLKWARRTIGFTIKEAADRLKIKEERLISWENGDELVPITKLKILSKVFKRPSAIFLLNKEPNENIPAKFRQLIDLHINSFTSDTLLAIRKAVRTQNIAKEILNLGMNEFVENLRNLSGITDYEKIGNVIFNLLKANIDEITKSKSAFEQLNYWKQIIESKGIYILEIGFPINEAKGFAIYDQVAPVIVLNARDYPNSRIFTLMHELSHFIYERNVISDENNILNFKSNDRIEVACNYIAGSILVPQDVLNEKIRRLNINFNNLDTDLEILSKVFNISREVILRRLLINKFINDDEFKIKHTLFKSNYKEKEKTKGGNFYIKYLKNNSRSFINNILDAYRVNRISYGDALDYLNIKSETLSKLEARI